MAFENHPTGTGEKLKHLETKLKQVRKERDEWRHDWTDRYHKARIGLIQATALLRELEQENYFMGASDRCANEPLLERLAKFLAGRPTESSIPIVDAEIQDLVTALNVGGIETVASCSGHGYRTGSIAMRDGRWLIIAADRPEWEKIEAIFPTDTNGINRLAGQSAGHVCANGKTRSWPAVLCSNCVKGKPLGQPSKPRLVQARPSVEECLKVLRDMLRITDYYERNYVRYHNTIESLKGIASPMEQARVLLERSE